MTTKQLEVKEASIVTLNRYPGEKEPTFVLTLHAPLTMALAESLKCKDLAFNLNDLPRDFDGKIGLKHELADIEIKFDGYLGGLRPTKLWKFRISRDTELNLGLDLRIHFRGKEDGRIINDVADHFNQDKFGLFIRSLQGELFAPTPTGQEDSTDDPEEAEEDDMLRVSCENAIPAFNGVHENGIKCKTANAAPLASVTQINGRKKRTGNRPDPDAERAAQVKAGKAAGEPEAEFAGVTR
jgi:hypothetical protein